MLVAIVVFAIVDALLFVGLAALWAASIYDRKEEEEEEEEDLASLLLCWPEGYNYRGVFRNN